MPAGCHWPKPALFGLILAASLSCKAESLPEAVAQATRSNPEVRAAMNRRFAADEGLKQAQSGYLPRLDLNAGTGREQVDDPVTRATRSSNATSVRRDSSLTLTQTLFDGAATSSEVARQRARIDSTSYNLAAVAEDVGLRTALTYLEVLRRRETVAAAQDNLDAHQRLFDQIRRLSEGGVGRQIDVDQTRSRVALASATLRAEQSSLKDAETAYVRLVGAPPGELVRPAPGRHAIPASESQALETALASHPALQASSADVAAAGAQQRAARAALLPRVDLELGVSHDRDRRNGAVDDRSLMLRLRYNLSSGGADSARVRETGYQLEEARETAERIRRQVQESVLQAYNAYRTAQDRLVELREYMESASITREGYGKQFRIGQRTLVDLLNAENEYYNARFAYITGQYLELAGIFRIQAGMGQLLRNMAVPLPRE